ncbi:uncharacterized protein LOC119745024 [Patiria miniata]|uniref:EF-hand domain-containing protein n=1 Tax=Patiria miniata TaxID=46514 RepID=A0A914BMK5_PATMI|nr:uncharacterized protein LOC119745024 [Patiria miniata]
MARFALFLLIVGVGSTLGQGGFNWQPQPPQLGFNWQQPPPQLGFNWQQPQTNWQQNWQQPLLPKRPQLPQIQVPQPRPNPIEEFIGDIPVVGVFKDGAQVAPGVYVQPKFNFGKKEVGVAVRFEFKRSVSQPTKAGAFSLLDIDGNGSLSVEEWHAHKGGVVNFASFLESVDTDENEEVSWAEFQTVNRVYTRNSDVATGGMRGRQPPHETLSQFKYAFQVKAQ